MTVGGMGWYGMGVGRESFDSLATCCIMVRTGRDISSVRGSIHGPYGLQTAGSDGSSRRPLMPCCR
jgi:hypothetical protein